MQGGIGNRAGSALFTADICQLAVVRHNPRIHLHRLQPLRYALGGGVVEPTPHDQRHGRHHAPGKFGLIEFQRGGNWRPVHQTFRYAGLLAAKHYTILIHKIPPPPVASLARVDRQPRRIKRALRGGRVLHLQ